MGKEKLKIKIDGIEKEIKPRVFKSGREGYGCYGIVEIKGLTYRLSLNLIKCGI